MAAPSVPGVTPIGSPSAHAPPLPSGTGLFLDRSVRRMPGGVLVGGAPVRIVRLSAAGGRLVDGWIAGEPVGPTAAVTALARRLIDVGLAHPRPPPAEPEPDFGSGSGSGPGTGPPAAPDVTVVIPVHDRPLGVMATLAALSRDQPLHPRIGSVIVVDDGSGDPAAVRGRDRRGARAGSCPSAWSAGPPMAARRQPATADGGRPGPSWWRFSTPSANQSPAGWAGSFPCSTTPSSPRSPPGSFPVVSRGPRRGSRRTRRSTRPSTWARARRRYDLGAGSPTFRPQPWSCAAAPWINSMASTRPYVPAKTWT